MFPEWRLSSKKGKQNWSSSSGLGLEVPEFHSVTFQESKWDTRLPRAGNSHLPIGAATYQYEDGLAGAPFGE